VRWVVALAKLVAIVVLASVVAAVLLYGALFVIEFLLRYFHGIWDPL
jgi:hypothetical protein